MKRFLILVLFAMAAINLSAAPNVSIQFVDDQNDLQNVTATAPLPVDAVVNISSVSVTAFPVYANPSGVATAEVDTNNRVKVNITSMTISLPAGTNSIGTVVPSVGVSTSSPIITDEYGDTTASTTVITLTATPVLVTSLAGRRSIAYIASGVFQSYIGTTTTPVASTADLYDESIPDCGPEIPVLLGTNATNTVVTIKQKGRP